MKKYKYITIKQEGLQSYNNKPIYRIFNNKSCVQIGMLSFYKPWKEYVFSAPEDCVFNDGCLRDVLNFLNLIKEGKVPAQ